VIYLLIIDQIAASRRSPPMLLAKDLKGYLPVFGIARNPQDSEAIVQQYLESKKTPHLLFYAIAHLHSP
jgi:hypothetical protein